MNISTGIIKSAQKIVIYGSEGIGKSTFASKFPKPLFIDTEGSTKKLNVARFDRPSSWEMLLQQVQYVKVNGICETLVIDTADWAEKLCIQHVCFKAKKDSIEDFGYGKGYVYLQEEFGKLLNLLEDVIEIGVNVVITAHAKMRKFEQPDEMGSYDRWELKLEKQTAPLLKEWADTLLFANYKTYVTQVAKDKYKAQGQQRVMYTTHNACYDAKNRDGLPEELPFEYKQIEHIINHTVSQFQSVDNITYKPKIEKTQNDNNNNFDKILDKKEETVSNTKTQTTNQNQELPSYIPKALADLMITNDVTEADIQLVVSQRGYYPRNTSIANYDKDFINGCLVGAWDKMYKLILNNQDLPF